MRKRPILAVSLAAALVLLGIPAAMIAFGTAAAPEPLPMVRTAMAGADLRNRPPLERFVARDGTLLTYRAYGAEGGRVAILVHGAMGESSFMHPLGQALRAAGVAAYAPNLRGHGGDGRAGDIDYVGQLEDDLADFVAALRPKHPGAAFVLLGHSAGGGLALRVAEGRHGELFERFVLLAPMLPYGAPTNRPDVGGLARPYLPRLVALTVLDRLGVHALEALPVIAFGAPADVPFVLTGTYSYRLLANFTPAATYLVDLAKVARPITLLAGEKDEVFVAEQYAPLLKPHRPDIAVAILPGVGHAGIIIDPEALAAAVAAVGDGPPVRGRPLDRRL